MSRSRFRCLARRLIPTVAVAASVISTPAVVHAQGSVLDPTTDVSVMVDAPRRITNGSDLQAVITITNRGAAPASSILCSTATPRLDAVENFTVGRTTTLRIEPVVGSVSHDFRIESLAPGQSVRVAVGGAVRSGPSLQAFTITAVCFPSPVDAVQQNNAAVAMVEITR